mgnify:CR=1 FL=1
MIQKHLLILFLGVFLAAEVVAVDEPQPIVKKVGETTYRVGLIEFDAKTREISVPVVVNQREGGPIEYVLVSEVGKTHEAILTTKARPMDLQIALKLLKYKAGEADRLIPGPS